MPPTLRPTDAQYQAFAAAFDHFNRELFGGRLAQPMLTFSRRKMTHGLFIAHSWRPEAGGEVHEIALNPDQLSQRSARQVASTLVHEMCHAFQEEFGRPSRRAYHNREFAQIMEERGLRTSSDGTASGRRTGQRITHVELAGGAFAKAFERLGGEVLLPFTCLTRERGGARPPDRSKRAYRRPSGRGRTLWGASGLSVIDAASGELYLEQEGEAGEPVPVGPHKAELFRWVAQLEETVCRQLVEALRLGGEEW